MRKATVMAMLGAIVATALAVGAPGAQAQERPLTVELNKFEAGEEGGCRAFFLFRNGGERTFDGFEMSLAILDGGGVIDRLLTIDAAPLPAGRTTLKLFEIPDIACDSISEVLLHDMTACNAQNEGPADCFGLMELVSRTSARFVE
ncbi:MAG: hypothetical protein ACOCXK_01940 [Rhodosalinus sp.]